MRKLALIMTAFGFVAFAGVARADHEKTENSVKTETGNTLGGKRKSATDKTVERADGSKVETKTETVYPKADDRDTMERRDIDKRDERDVKSVRDENGNTEEKVEHKTTLTGKKQTKTVKKNADGSETTTTTTRTDADHDKK
jgi:hypothetical protein